MRIFAFALVALASLSCASRQQPSNANQTAASSASASLQASSSIACTADGECAVCYRAQSCGEPIGAADPALETPECHVTPAPFCMPRRGRCEQGHCVAR
jgi:hypothetical protein